MKKIILTLAFSFMPLLSAIAQVHDVRIGIQVGYNSYQLYDLKEMDRYVASSVPGQLLFPVHEFPDYGSFGLEVSAIFKGYVVGLQYSFHSTGSRYDYSDYSGEAGLNSVLNGNFLGISWKVPIVSSKDHSRRFYGGIASNYIWGTYTINQFINVSNFNTSASTDFKTRGIGTEPFFSVEQSLGRLVVSFDFGYDVTISSRLLFQGKPVAAVSNGNGEASVNWDGLRMSLGVMIKLGKKSSRKSL